MISRSRTTTTLAVLAAAGLMTAFAQAVPAGAAPPPTTAASGAGVDCNWAATPGLSLDAAFDRAAGAAGVPVGVLKALSYNESRWDSHDGTASADGGYGPMNLTDLAVPNGAGKGDGSVKVAESAQTARLGSELTGLSLAAIKNSPNANVCAGAAVLASYRDAAAGPAADVNSWTGAVGRYGVAGSGGSGADFAALVFGTLRSGQSRVTADGQRVSLAPQPEAVVPSAATDQPLVDCPGVLHCEWLPAPYAKINPADPDSTGNYGNHDIADRTGAGGPALKYIVIHDTEGGYQGTVNLAQDPTYLAWNYTVRSSDGHIAQHLNPKDVGWHAGNWYINMHSIGVEHEGKAGNAGWFTEAMYVKSAKLVKYLAHKYDIPLDTQHIIGHDQVPGILPGYTKSVHWDPGPYWDWEHYFDLLGAPIGGTGAHSATTTDVAAGDVVIVRPGYAGNTNPQTQCEEQSPGSGPCQDDAATNFVALHQEPSADSPLAKDIGTHPTGNAAGTVRVNDVSAKAQAGNVLVVAGVQGDWVKVSWAGEFAWLHNPASHPVLVKSTAPKVTVKPGAVTAAVYGRVYPEASAYPSVLTPQAVVPIEYTIKPGQEYALTDSSVVTDYYRAVSFDGSAPGDRTDVVGQDVYLQIALAHRIMFVRAADVQVTP